MDLRAWPARPALFVVLLLLALPVACNGVAGPASTQAAAPPTPGQASRQQAPAQAPRAVRQTATIVRMGCSTNTDEVDAVGLALVAGGSADVDEGVRVITSFAYEGRSPYWSDEVYRAEIPQRQVGAPASVNWVASSSEDIPLEDIPPSRELHVAVIVLAYGADEPLRTHPGTELARGEFSCHLPEPRKPTVQVMSVECVPLERTSEGTVYEIRAHGMVAGPEGAQALFSNLTDIDPPGAFSPVSLQTKWTPVGYPVPTGAMRDPAAAPPPPPAITEWRFVSRSVPLPDGQRTAIARAVLSLGDGQSGFVAERRLPCGDLQLANQGAAGGAALDTAAPTPTPTPEPTATPQPTSTPIPTPTPVLTPTIDPARNLTGTWRGGINLVPIEDQEGCVQWSGTLVLEIQHDADGVRGLATVTLDKVRDIRSGKVCDSATLDPVELLIDGNASATNVSLNLGEDVALTGRFTTDLMSGDADWGDFAGCWQVARTALGALGDCINNHISTPTPVPPTPTPTFTPTPRPTAIPLVASVTSLTCTAASSRVVNESANARTVTYVTWRVDAAGTASGPVNARVLLEGLLLGPWTLATGDWSAEDGATTGSRGRTPVITRRSDQPANTTWMLTGTYEPSGYYSTDRPFPGEAAERPFEIKLSPRANGTPGTAICKK